MMKLVVLSCLLAAASAVVPWGLGPVAYTLGGIGNYRGPLSLAPGQPANVLGWDGRPLDTLDVNLDRSAHIIARATAGHILKKRSVVPVTAPLITSSLPLTYGVHGPLTVPTVTGLSPLTTWAAGRIATPYIW